MKSFYRKYEFWNEVLAAVGLVFLVAAAWIACVAFSGR
jgi:hypothetical protein